MSGTGFALTWGGESDVPIVADHDGDGIADPTVFRPLTSWWYSLRSSTSTGYGLLWGAPGDLLTSVVTSGTVAINGPTSARAGELVAFQAFATPPSVRIVACDFEWGDGTSSGGSGDKRSHIYLALGQYAITVTATTIWGGELTAQTVITVTY